MNLRQFECLRAIMTTGSMTRAAESLGISQPSASSLISNLEHTLGFKLFDRVKGRLVATPEAKHFLPDVSRALDSIDLAVQKARQIRDNRLGDLTIAAYPDIAIDFLPKVMSAVLADKPGVRARLLARRTEMMSGLLPTQEFDMAIVSHVAETPDFDVEEISLPCVVAFHPDQAPPPGSVLGPADLQDARLVTVLPTHPTVVQLYELFRRAGLTDPRVEVETQTFESAAGFVRHGTGVALIDVIAAARYAGGGLEVRRFEPEIRQSIFLLTPLERPKSRLLVQFRQRLLQELDTVVARFRD